MKDIKFRLIIIVAAIVLSVYLLYPTWKDYQNTKQISKTLEQKASKIKGMPDDQKKKLLLSIEDSIKLNTPDIRDARLKRVKLGLDLQGGMRLVLEVNTAKLLEKLPEKADDAYRQIIAEASREALVSDQPIVDLVVQKFKEKNIPLRKYFGSVRDEDSKIISDLTTQTEDAVSRAMQIIRNRVDQYGVSEPTIQRQGDRRIVVELPGIAREEEARQLLQGTALLEFKMLKEPEFTFNLMTKIDDLLAGKSVADSVKADSTLAKNDTSSAKKDTANEKNLSKEEFTKKHPFFAIAQPVDQKGQTAEAYVLSTQRDLLMRYLSRQDVKNIMGDAMFILSAKPIPTNDGQNIYVMYCVNRTAVLTGGVITQAIATVDPNTSQPVVNMEMNTDGSTEWARITGANIGKRCAIVLDDAVFSAPVIRNKITGGRSQIEGMGDMQEAKLLEIVLKAGALPAPVDIIEERTIGPSLGSDSVTQGTNSLMFGYLIVGIFMIFYYQRTGSIAALGLTLTILFIFGILAGFQATLTLPGIAGIVLTMGMAVDANVLIYERIREELAVGKTWRAAVDSGFSKAYSAIIDSNITTLITAVILYQFGTGPIQGFALTLMIGIFTSMFSALVIARMVIDFMLNKGYKVTIG